MIIGNPPYNANQPNENDNNKNREYPRHRRAHQGDVHQGDHCAEDQALRHVCAFLPLGERPPRARTAWSLSSPTAATLEAERSTASARWWPKISAKSGIVDLGGDVRANPKLSGTKHNVFGIQTGVAIGFLVKRAKAQGCRIFYRAGRKMETAEEKLSWLSKARLDGIEHSEIRPDAKHNWLNLTDNDFDSLLPVASKAAKAAKKPSQEKAIFKLFSLGVVTARDEWVYGFSEEQVEDKVTLLIDTYNADRKRLLGSPHDSNFADKLNATIKWSRAVKKDLRNDVEYSISQGWFTTSLYRPFVKQSLYFSKRLNEMTYQLDRLFPTKDAINPYIACVAGARLDFSALAGNVHSELCAVFARSGAVLFALSAGKRDSHRQHHRLGAEAVQGSLQKSRHPGESRGPASFGDLEAKSLGSGLRRNDEQKQGKRAKARAITKEDIFHYVYAVLHDPVYREKYAQNLKREFPRIPFYPDFGAGPNGAALMELHIGYETVDAVAARAHRHRGREGAQEGATPKALLKAEKDWGASCWIRKPRSPASRASVGIQARQPFRDRMGPGPVQGKEAQGPDHPREIQHLSLRRLQGEHDRAARARWCA